MFLLWFLLYAYLTVCLVLFLGLVGTALYEDWVQYRRGFRYDAEKATPVYQIMHASEYCLPHYRNIAAYCGILCITMPGLNLLLLSIVILIYATIRKT